jgi:predicted nucleic acid-binding protein
MLLVADSSSLIALSIADSLNLLDQLYGTIRIPRAVYSEVTSNNKPQSIGLREYLQDKIVDFEAGHFFIDDHSLGAGELEAMMLCKQLKADLLLVDDRRARRIAVLNKINTIGSLGVLLEAKQKKIIENIRPAILKIYSSDIYITLELCNYVLNKTGEPGI